MHVISRWAFLAGLQPFLAREAGAELSGPASKAPASWPPLSVALEPCRPQEPGRPSTNSLSRPLTGLMPLVPTVQVLGVSVSVPGLEGGAAAGMRLWLLVEEDAARRATTATPCCCR